MSELIANPVVQKLRRLSATKPRELAHRVRERVSVEMERMGVATASPLPPSDFKAYLKGDPADRFYCSHRQDLHGFVRQNFSEWLKASIHEAENLCEHEVPLLGYAPVQLGHDIDWHRDPITGALWEGRFWAEYDLVHANGGRDPKIIHEVNRQAHLPRLAKAYRFTGEERYATEAVAQLLSW